MSYYLYKGISTILYLLLSLFASLMDGSLQLSLLTSLPSLLICMRNEVLQSSLQSNFVRASPITSIWKIFLHPLYKDIYAGTPI